MKYSAALLSMAALAAAKPALTNTAFALKEGKPFTLTFSGCDDGCTIELQNGSATDLKDYKTLTSTSHDEPALETHS